MRSLVVVGLLAGCVADRPRASFAWDIGTHPAAVLADGTTDPGWTEMVEAARAEWSAPLVAMGCDDPFEGPAETPVILVPGSEWQIPNATGNTSIARIVVRGTMAEELVNGSYNSVLPHELGHALGLTHVGDLRDPYSIMHPTSDQTAPSQLDLLRAADLIGCR